MSHTNQTANYHLPQFIGTDKPAWLVDVNQAYADIDTQMKANETASATAEADAQSALSGVTALTSQVGTLQTSVTALETKQPLDEAQIETNRQNIATNAQNIVDLDNRMGHTSIATIGDGTATGAIADLQGQINNIPSVSDMVGATASTDGSHGLVPKPSAGDEGKFLKGDGTWGTPSGANEYVEVNADGVKTVAQNLNALSALIDRSKVTPRAVLCGVVPATGDKWFAPLTQLMAGSAGNIYCDRTSASSSDGNILRYNIANAGGGQIVVRCTTSGIAVQDNSSSVDTSGYIYRFYY